MDMKVEFPVLKKEYDAIMAKMPTREQAMEIRVAKAEGKKVPYNFAELIDEKYLEIDVCYGTLELTLKAFGAEVRRFFLSGHIRIDVPGCRDSGPVAFTEIEPDELYSKEGVDLSLYDGGIDSINVRFVRRRR